MGPLPLSGQCGPALVRKQLCIILEEKCVYTCCTSSFSFITLCNDKGIHLVRFLYLNNSYIASMRCLYTSIPGWESQLLETGFLALFLCPILSLRQLPRHTPTPWVVVWGYRWLVFRIMLGAVCNVYRCDIII